MTGLELKKPISFQVVMQDGATQGEDGQIRLKSHRELGLRATQSGAKISQDVKITQLDNYSYFGPGLALKSHDMAYVALCVVLGSRGRG